MRSASYRLEDDATLRSEVPRLRRQAKLFTASLAPVLKAAFAHREQIVDLGCGPGYHLAELCRLLAPSAAVGIDRNDRLLDVARTLPVDARWLRDDLVAPAHANTLLLGAANALVLAQLVFQHMNELEQASFLAWLVEARPRESVFVAIESHLAEVEACGPARTLPALLRRACAIQRGRGGRPDVAARLASDLAGAGLEVLESRRIVIDSLGPGCAALLPILVSIAATERDRAGTEEKRCLGELEALANDDAAATSAEVRLPIEVVIASWRNQGGR